MPASKRSQLGSPQLQRFFDFLAQRNAGDIVSDDEIVAASQWKPSAWATHVRKNKHAPFLAPVGGGRYRVLRDGSTLTEDEVAEAFGQVKPKALGLGKGTRLTGSLAEYELTSFVGRGAVAQVWRAIDTASGRAYAAKIMDPRADLLEPSQLDNVRKRFTREAMNGCKLNHPNVVAYRDRGALAGEPFLMMDLADESVADILKGGPVRSPRTLAIVLDCLRGLECIHGAACVHRDVKPLNLLRFGERFVVADLGIVRWCDFNPAFTSAGSLTVASIQLGSWYYMAPEQRSSPHSATSASDVYALGVSWYEMLTGVTPDPALVAAQRFKPPTADSDICALIQQMLLFDAEARPTTAVLIDEIARLHSAVAEAL